MKHESSLHRENSVTMFIFSKILKEKVAINKRHNTCIKGLNTRKHFIIGQEMANSTSAILQIYGEILQIYWAILQIYWAILQIYWAIQCPGYVWCCVFVSALQNITLGGYLNTHETFKHTWNDSGPEIYI